METCSNIRLGYDQHGVVYEENDCILRKISSDYFKEVKELFDLYKRYNLNKVGIVDTSIDLQQQALLHKKHIISYPFEWPAQMFKDSVSYHLNLFLELEKLGLTLKDALPNNVLFDFTKPIFVDFLSLVRKEKLQNEEWLVGLAKNKKDALSAVIFRTMFIPHMLIPLIVMSRKDFSSARHMLFEKACNRGNVAPCWNDLFENKGQARFFKNFIKTLVLKYQVNSCLKKSLPDTCKTMLSIVNQIDAEPAKSGYSSYYDLKSENFNIDGLSTWKNKQKNVYSIIAKLRPKTVLDLGANTGWFSVLAAKEGANVISTDIDESCANVLYNFAKNANLNILSLVLSFEDLAKVGYGVADSDSVYKDRNFKNNPLFLPATQRFNSELVLCLALIHHLVLGQGQSIEHVVKILESLTQKSLIIEFVGLDDNLIKQEPLFFKNLYKHNHDSYNINILVKEGLKYFSSYEILDSQPDSRKLVVFNK